MTPNFPVTITQMYAHLDHSLNGKKFLRKEKEHAYYTHKFPLQLSACREMHESISSGR